MAQGCGSAGEDAAAKPAPAAQPAPASSASAAAPASAPATGATSLEDFDPATDPVLGWWKPNLDPADDTKVSFLWPTDANDARALRTIRFLNDGMATNGCCAGAEWTFAAPRFYKVNREIHELYYLADSGSLYFLTRTDPAKSAALFQKIIAGITAGKSIESLTESGLLEAPVKFSRALVR
jgi:hypothetical protein